MTQGLALGLDRENQTWEKRATEQARRTASLDVTLEERINEVEQLYSEKAGEVKNLFNDILK